MVQKQNGGIFCRTSSKLVSYKNHSNILSCLKVIVLGFSQATSYSTAVVNVLKNTIITICYKKKTLHTKIHINKIVFFNIPCIWVSPRKKLPSLFTCRERNLLIKATLAYEKSTVSNTGGKSRYHVRKPFVCYPIVPREITSFDANCYQKFTSIPKSNLPKSRKRPFPM